MQATLNILMKASAEGERDRRACHRMARRKDDAEVIGEERGELDIRIGHSLCADSEIDLLAVDSTIAFRLPIKKAAA